MLTEMADKLNAAPIQHIGTNHDHGVEMVGVAALFFAFGRGQLNQGHTRIIPLS
jgi:hypothetical protein